jgi:uncharacterized membrane protein YjfL (UPF0719 family)
MTHLPDYFLSDIAATIAFGFIAIVLVIIGYKLFDRATPKLPFDEEIKKGNLAMAVVIGSFILGLCYVIGRVVAAILS